MKNLKIRKESKINESVMSITNYYGETVAEIKNRKIAEYVRKNQAKSSSATIANLYGQKITIDVLDHYDGLTPICSPKTVTIASDIIFDELVKNDDNLMYFVDKIFERLHADFCTIDGKPSNTELTKSLQAIFDDMQVTDFTEFAKPIKAINYDVKFILQGCTRYNLTNREKSNIIRLQNLKIIKRLIITAIVNRIDRKDYEIDR